MAAPAAEPPALAVRVPDLSYLPLGTLRADTREHAKRAFTAQLLSSEVDIQLAEWRRVSMAYFETRVLEAGPSTRLNISIDHTIDFYVWREKRLDTDSDRAGNEQCLVNYFRQIIFDEQTRQEDRLLQPSSFQDNTPGIIEVQYHKPDHIRGPVLYAGNDKHQQCNLQFYMWSRMPFTWQTRRTFCVEMPGHLANHAESIRLLLKKDAVYTTEIDNWTAASRKTRTELAESMMQLRFTPGPNIRAPRVSVDCMAWYRDGLIAHDSDLMLTPVNTPSDAAERNLLLNDTELVAILMSIIGRTECDPKAKGKMVTPVRPGIFHTSLESDELAALQLIVEATFRSVRGYWAGASHLQVPGRLHAASWESVMLYHTHLNYLKVKEGLDAAPDNLRSSIPGDGEKRVLMRAKQAVRWQVAFEFFHPENTWTIPVQAVGSRTSFQFGTHLVNQARIMMNYRRTIAQARMMLSERDIKRPTSVHTTTDTNEEVGNLMDMHPRTFESNIAHYQQELQFAGFVAYSRGDQICDAIRSMCLTNDSGSLTAFRFDHMAHLFSQCTPAAINALKQYCHHQLRDGRINHSRLVDAPDGSMPDWSTPYETYIVLDRLLFYLRDHREMAVMGRLNHNAQRRGFATLSILPDDSMAHVMQMLVAPENAYLARVNDVSLENLCQSIRHESNRRVNCVAQLIADHAHGLNARNHPSASPFVRENNLLVPEFKLHEDDDFPLDGEQIQVLCDQIKAVEARNLSPSKTLAELLIIYDHVRDLATSNRARPSRPDIWSSSS